MVMAICNTVVVSSSTHQNRNETEDIPQPQNENEPASGVADLCELKYEAESPDEAALVEVSISTLIFRLELKPFNSVYTGCS